MKTMNVLNIIYLLVIKVSLISSQYLVDKEPWHPHIKDQNDKKHRTFIFTRPKTSKSSCPVPKCERSSFHSNATSYIYPYPTMINGYHFPFLIQ